MKFFLLLLCLTATLSTSAQRIRFTDTTNKWSLLYFTDDPANQIASSRYVADTIIAGHTYHRLTTATGSTLNTLAVREDTLQEKIYFRFVTSRFVSGSSTDTFEHLLFDYQLAVGDTLRTDNGSDHFLHVVQVLDSVRLGSDFYKHWVMTNSNGSGAGYDFIEGIGTNYFPAFGVYTRLTFSGFQLRCFTNKGTRPVCTPPMPLPFSNFTPSSRFDFVAAKQFDNDSSCAIDHAPVGVPGIAANTAPVLSPNPGGKESTLEIPAAIGKARLYIMDVVGHSIAEMVFEKAASIPIGSYVSLPGIYYYVLQDALTGRRYAGRFIFR